MPEPLDYTPVVRKLLEKSEQDRVDWQGHYGYFTCKIDGGYKFESRQNDDVYSLTMLDSIGEPIFSLQASDEIVFGNQKQAELFKMLRDIYELARRRALGVDEKLAEVSKVLDTI